MDLFRNRVTSSITSARSSDRDMTICSTVLHRAAGPRWRRSLSSTSAPPCNSYYKQSKLYRLADDDSRQLEWPPPLDGFFSALHPKKVPKKTPVFLSNKTYKSRIRGASLLGAPSWATFFSRGTTIGQGNTLAPPLIYELNLWQKWSTDSPFLDKSGE